MCSNPIYFILLLLLALGAETTNFKENCRAALNRGRTVIENHVPAILHEEMARVRRKIDQRMEEMFKAEVGFC
ncbi:hypothetical protein GCK32_022503 [Trichostrongylus colubriformis]|uniref:Uncharacterized protein n=1 Tax=Trichostrongylus colubriformis TaxID=6319 RepID=A0AAN8F5B7_TRICO